MDLLTTEKLPSDLYLSIEGQNWTQCHKKEQSEQWSPTTVLYSPVFLHVLDVTGT